MKTPVFSPILLIALLPWLAACRTTPPVVDQAPIDRRTYIDSAAMSASSYRTWGFYQATAIRYSDPAEPYTTRGFIFQQKVNRDGSPYRPVTVRHTDELIWRVLADQMEVKGYQQIAPEQADLLVVYYGGPRPVEAAAGLKVAPTPFDAYFAQFERTPYTFYIDIIDRQTQTLLYRSWDNSLFQGITTTNDVKSPGGEKVVRMVEDLMAAFPGRH